RGNPPFDKLRNPLRQTQNPVPTHSLTHTHTHSHSPTPTPTPTPTHSASTLTSFSLSLSLCFPISRITSKFPVSDLQIARKRMVGMCEAMITRIDVTGTEMIMPRIPQISPQNANAKRVPRGLRFSVLPITR